MKIMDCADLDQTTFVLKQLPSEPLIHLPHKVYSRDFSPLHVFLVLGVETSGAAPRTGYRLCRRNE